MKASVIVPTHNRENLLGRVLAYYCRQDLPKNRYEVVVVDDGSSDETSLIFKGLKDIIDDAAKPLAGEYQRRVISAKQGLFEPDNIEGFQNKQGPINLKYIQLEKSGRSISRNTGIFYSSYPLIIFADDDIFVEPGFVKKHIEAHTQEDRCVVMGKVIHTGDLEKPLSARWKPKDINTAFLATGNASVLKKHLFQAGLFDEEYTVYGWEDFDLGIHLEENGLESHKRNIYGYHYDPPGETLKPDVIYGKERGSLL
jgi:glycosyltransferase involved in cell wall biosynthesis